MVIVDLPRENTGSESKREKCTHAFADIQPLTYTMRYRETLLVFAGNNKRACQR